MVEKFSTKLKVANEIQSRRMLREGKKKKRKPTSKPLDVIGVTGRFDGLDGVVGGKNQTDEVGDDLGTDVEEDREEEGRAEGDGGVGLGHLRLCLEPVQRGVLRQLP